MQELEKPTGLICRRCGNFICKFEDIKNCCIRCKICDCLVSNNKLHCCPICFDSIVSVFKTYLCVNLKCAGYTINLMTNKPTLYCRGDPCASFSFDNDRKVIKYNLRRRYKQGDIARQLVKNIIQWKLDNLC